MTQSNLSEYIEDVVVLATYIAMLNKMVEPFIIFNLVHETVKVELKHINSQTSS